MKAVVYGAEWKGLWQWYLSIDTTLQTDLTYWVHRDPSIRLWRAGEPMPWGQAVAEVERRNKETSGEWPFFAGVGASGVMGKMDREDIAGTAGGMVRLDKLAERMQGKSLLAEEFVALVDSLGEESEDWRGASKAADGYAAVQSVADDRRIGGREVAGSGTVPTAGSGGQAHIDSSLDWIRLTQWAYLNGVIAYDASVQKDDQVSWLAWGRRRSASCRRCGASGKLLKWTYCASCEAECPYCERCLSMGRARYCTPLIRGMDWKRSGAFDRFSTQEITLPNLKLSPAQTEASEAGVQFILAGAPSVRSDRGGWSDQGDQMSPSSRQTETRRGSQRETGESGDRGNWKNWSNQGSLADESNENNQSKQSNQRNLSNLSVGSSHSPGDVREWQEARHQSVREFLIWAVTGAGKTEMIFPLIAAERSRGGRVLIATPRKDVVLELLPRLRAAFPGERVVGLYGGSAERWETGHLVVSTTHQLFRYEAAFDLVVLDEVDAFPYHGDEMLAYVARKACKPGAAFVMLSATPPRDMQRAARSGKLPCVKVPVRYHRHPLPVPSLLGLGRLVPLLRQSLERGAQAFVFVPQIARLEPELARLRKALAGRCAAGHIEATSSQDPMREEKVRRLRAGDIRILLATTILERGVTIPKADVIVLDADSRLFDAAALIQMAGRAGRSAADPYGQVAFLAKQRTRAQARAVRQIRAMNRLARRKGYLL